MAHPTAHPGDRLGFVVMATDWIEVGAELAVAVGTLALAGVTAWMVKGTREGVRNTLREAIATENLAAEARTDRQLAWRPQLELMDYHHEPQAAELTMQGYGTPDFSFHVRSTGAGPALQVVAITREVENIGRWCIVGIGDLRPGDKREADGELWPSGGSVSSPFEGFPGATEADIVTVVLLCGDVLGRRWRFGWARGVGTPPTVPTRKYVGSNASVIDENVHRFHTGWADEPLIWG
jgi:hypothetical protein